MYVKNSPISFMDKRKLRVHSVGKDECCHSLNLILLQIYFQGNAETFLQSNAIGISILWPLVRIVRGSSPHHSYIRTRKLAVCLFVCLLFIPIYSCRTYRKYLHDNGHYNRKVMGFFQLYHLFTISHIVEFNILTLGFDLLNFTKHFAF